MKKTLVLTLLASLIFPALSFAGVEGRYDFDKKKMLEQIVPMVIKQRKIPKAMHKMVMTKMKQKLSERDMWMELSAKGKFTGWTQKKGDKKPSIGATGKWTLSGKKLTIISVSVKKKKETTMNCIVGKKTLSCKDARNPKITVHFNKK